MIKLILKSYTPLLGTNLEEVIYICKSILKTDKIKGI